MSNLVTRTSSVQNIGISESDITVTAVTQFIQSLTSRTAQNNIELSSAEFEQNSLEQNAEFFIRNENNPLVYGLQNLDRAAMVIKGKSAIGVQFFANRDERMCLPPSVIESSPVAVVTDIVLQTLGMLEAVKSGLPRGLQYATEFNRLCVLIAKDIKRGILVFTKYNDDIYNVGNSALVEWSNNG